MNKTISYKNETVIEVFKTNVQWAFQSEHLIEKLLELFPKSRINFDLDDCDKVLRMESAQLYPIRIIELINRNGFECSVLE